MLQTNDYIDETSIKKPNSGDALLTVQVRNIGTSSIDSVTDTLNGITLGADISGSGALVMQLVVLLYRTIYALYNTRLLLQV